MSTAPAMPMPERVEPKSHETNKETTPDGICITLAKIIDKSAKNVLRTIRQFFMWISLTFESLKYSKPLINLVKFMKTGEDAFAFKDFIKSSFILLHDIVNITKTGLKDAFWTIKTHTLDVIWNTMKIFKALATHGAYTLSSKYLIPLTGVGGAAFALNSFSRFKSQFFKVDKLLHMPSNTDTELYKKEQADIFGRMFDIAKNIGTCVIGTLVTLGAIYGYVAPGLVYLTLGTTILVTEIAAVAIQQTYSLNFKDVSL